MKINAMTLARHMMAAGAMMLGVSGMAQAGDMLPTDAADACPISNATIAGWFVEVKLLPMAGFHRRTVLPFKPITPIAIFMPGHPECFCG